MKPKIKPIPSPYATTLAGGHAKLGATPTTPTEDNGRQKCLQANLQITDDPLPKVRVWSNHKYESTFINMKPGQCIVCERDEAYKVNSALAKYFTRNGINAKTKMARSCQQDGKARVWWIPKEAT